MKRSPVGTVFVSIVITILLAVVLSRHSNLPQGLSLTIAFATGISGILSLRINLWYITVIATVLGSGLWMFHRHLGTLIGSSLCFVLAAIACKLLKSDTDESAVQEKT